MAWSVKLCRAGPSFLWILEKWTAGLELHVGGTKAGPTVLNGRILKVERRTDTKPRMIFLLPRLEVKSWRLSKL
jgi:hypothetical protein